jgi:ABC-2 type transport system permease protein
MSTQSNAVPGSPLDSQPTAPPPAPVAQTRPLYWSIRRELWEYRSIYIAPLAVAGVFLFGFLIGLIYLPHTLRASNPPDAMQQAKFIEQPYGFAAILIMGTTFIISIFYCLDALYGERRDRSILFWKSLPVSDFTTVLAKASIPLVILPLVTFVVTVATQFVMLLLSIAALAGHGLPLTSIWSHLSPLHMWAMTFYHLFAIHSLWYAPIYAWFMLVSAWSRRAPFLWAVLPLVAIGFLEKVAFNTSHFVDLLLYRISGGPEGAAYTAQDMPADHLSGIHPGQFLFSPGLWSGLIVAAAFLFAAVRLRRNREPI